MALQDGMKIITRNSYPKLIIEQILHAIKKGSLRPGDLLPSENELIQEFGVGRTSVREALAALEYMNIVVSESSGYYVNTNIQSFFSKKLLYHHKLDKKKHSDLLEVREFLETEFALLAAQRVTVNDVKRIRQILRGMEELLKRVSEDLPTEQKQEIAREFSGFLIEFHMAIARATHNSIYVRIYDRLKDLMFFAEDGLIAPSDMPGVFESLKKILKCIEERDYQKAASNMRERMERMKTQYALSQSKQRGDQDV